MRFAASVPCVVLVPSVAMAMVAQRLASSLALVRPLVADWSDWAHPKQRAPIASRALMDSHSRFAVLLRMELSALKLSALGLVATERSAMGHSAWEPWARQVSPMKKRLTALSVAVAKALVAKALAKVPLAMAPLVTAARTDREAAASAVRRVASYRL